MKYRAMVEKYKGEFVEISIPYHKMLKDPRWKAKRDEILRRDGYLCVMCSNYKTLQVHHGYYKPLTAPWLYENATLWTLCNECHSKLHIVVARIHKTIGLMHPDKYNDALAKSNQTV